MSQPSATTGSAKQSVTTSESETKKPFPSRAITGTAFISIFIPLSSLQLTYLVYHVSFDPKISTQIVFWAATILFLLFWKMGRFSIGSSDDFDEKLSKATSLLKTGSPEERVEPAWDVARITLDNYWKTNLSQNKSIFTWSVIAIIAGFFIFLYGTAKGISESSAIIAVSAGTVTQVIGATFLLVYRSTMSQATKFNETLERINSVGMAWYIVNSMEETTAHAKALKNRVKGELALRIVGSSVSIESNSENESKDPSVFGAIPSENKTTSVSGDAAKASRD